MLDLIQDGFPKRSLEWIKEFLKKHPASMKARAKKLIGQTLIHGDANPSNILSPRNSSGRTYIIDRQPFTWSFTHWLGVWDLAYMCEPFWEVEDRRRFERPMLEHYFQSLIEFGVSDYSWKQALLDYRLSVAQGIYVAMNWCDNEESLLKMRWLWEKQLERTLIAVSDWSGHGNE